MRTPVSASVLMFALAAALVGAGPFQSRPVLRVDAIALESPPKVRLFVTDLDEQGRARPPSAERSYQLLVNGLPEQSPAKVTTVGQAGEPVSLTIVVQLGPVFESVLPPLKDSLRAIVNDIPQSSAVRVIGYADDIVSDAKAKTPAEARQAIDALAVKPDALEMNLAGAMQAALTPAAGESAARRVVVVVSDGTSREVDPQRFAELGRYAGENGARIHSIGFAPIDDAPIRATLSVLSRKSGGTERVTAAQDQLRDALAALGDEVKHQRIVEYELPRVFTGQQYDFQIVAGDVASEPLARIVPKHEVESAGSWRPIAIALSAAAAVIAGAYAILAARKKKKQAAAAILDQLRAAPPAAAPLDLGKTLPGLRLDPPPSSAASTEKGPPPAAQATGARPIAAAPQVAAVPLLGAVPALAGVPPPGAVPPLASPAGPAQAPAQGAFGLPRPTEFMRRMKDTGEPSFAPGAAPLVPPAAAAPAAPASAPAPAPAPAAVLNMPLAPPAPLVPPRPLHTPVGLPPLVPALNAPAPSPVPAAPAAPRFVARKTQVLSPSELESVDVAGWLVPLPAGTPVLVLREGFKIGTDRADHVVPEAPGKPKQAFFELDPSGRFAVATAEGRKILGDGDTIEVGASRFVFKFAARFPNEVEDSSPYLQIVGGLDDGRRIRVGDGRPRVIGAHAGATAIVRGPGVADWHCAARLDGTVCEIADLGSRSGVRAHGQLVPTIRLTAGQDVQIGNVRLVFRVP